MNLLGKTSQSSEVLYGFTDKRNEKRMKLIVETLENGDLTKSMPKVFQPKGLKGFYRFIEHDQVSHHGLTQFFRKLYVQSIPAKSTYYLVQDSTELRLSKFVEGAGMLSGDQRHGVVLHNGLLTDLSGIPLGLAHQAFINRDITEYKNKPSLQNRAFESKESFKWADCLIQGYEICKENDIQLIHVMDREGDSSDVFNYANEFEQQVIIRSVHNRNTEDSVEIKKLWDTDNYGNHDFCYRELRNEAGIRKLVRCRVSWQKVKLNNIISELYAVHLKSVEPDFSVEWLLLTNIPEDSFERAVFIIDSYVVRWVIEEFHKCLKTGCGAEARRFATVETYLNSAAILSHVAVQLLRIKYLANSESSNKIADSLTEEERALLPKLAEKNLSLHEQSLYEKFTNAWVFLIIAKLGGFHRGTNRKPGWSVLWYGYMKYLDILEGYSLATSFDRTGDTG